MGGMYPTGSSVALFAGIGGLELGLSSSGIDPLLFCEIDEAAQSVLRSWKPLVPIHSDVRTLNSLPLKAHLLCAGFPCTDISVAGLKKGIHGEASGLVFEVFRLLNTHRIGTLIIENVPPILTLGDGEAMEAITGALTALGYRWAYRLVCSSALGIPHRRLRFFLVASLVLDPREVLLADDAGPAEKINFGEVDISTEAVGWSWNEGNGGWGGALNSIPPLRAGSKTGPAVTPAIMLPDGSIGTPHVDDGERLQGMPVGWTKVAPDERSRWRMLGNGVTREVPDWLGRRLNNPGRYDHSCDPAVSVSKRWPKAAWSGKDGQVHASPVSARPQDTPMPPIHAFLTKPLKPLSARATRGFLHRVSRHRINFPVGFVSRLHRHAEEMDAITPKKAA